MAGDEIERGDMHQIPLPQEEMGRIAAQTAKQILVQKVREAIREKVYDEYVYRKGELINGTVRRFERGDMIIDLQPYSRDNSTARLKVPTETPQ